MGAVVTLHRKRVHLATATVREHTDDSEHYVARPEQWLRLTVTEALDPRVRLGPMTLRRPLSDEGDYGWEPVSYRQIGRVRATFAGAP
jgi:hypothetical protein